MAATRRFRDAEALLDTLRNLAPHEWTTVGKLEELCDLTPRQFRLAMQEMRTAARSEYAGTVGRGYSDGQRGGVWMVQARKVYCASCTGTGHHWHRPHPDDEDAGVDVRVTCQVCDGDGLVPSIPPAEIRQY